LSCDDFVLNSHKIDIIEEDIKNLPVFSTWTDKSEGNELLLTFAVNPDFSVGKSSNGGGPSVEPGFDPE
jgi:hypothetical protein